MSAELTDKTMVVISRLGDYWVNLERAALIAKTIEEKPTGHIDLDGSIIRCSSIDGIVKAADYEFINIKRRGGWQCKYQKWHERNQQCAHAQMLR